MELLDLFPRTIAVAELQSLTPEVIASAIELIELSSNRDLPGDGAYTTDQQLLNRAVFRDVKQEVLKLCREFVEAYSHIVDGLHICNSWGNVIGHGEAIRYHKHSNAYVSGSFYLTDGSGFNITDHERGALFGFAPSLRDSSNYRAMQSFTIPARPRRIVLFPSGMMHSVLPSQTQAKRYSIAFNVIPVGRIGGPTGLMELRPVD